MTVTWRARRSLEASALILQAAALLSASDKARNGSQDFAPMPKRDADLFKIGVGQVRQYRQVDVVLGKALRVLPETELLKPVSDLLHRRSAPRFSGLTGPHRQVYP